MKTIFKTFLKILSFIILAPLRMIWALTWLRWRKPIIDDLKQAKRHEIAFVLAVLIGILIMLFNCGAKAVEFNLGPPKEFNWTIPLDLDRLYYAVSMAESGNCATEWHRKANNCVSIMEWKPQRRLKRYSSLTEGKEDFKRIWNKYYKVFPTIKEAMKYTGNDRATQWLINVKSFYLSGNAVM